MPNIDELIAKLESRLHGRGRKVNLTHEEAGELYWFLPDKKHMKKLYPVRGYEERVSVSRGDARHALDKLYEQRGEEGGEHHRYAAIFFLTASLLLASFSSTGYAIADGTFSALDVKPLLSVVFLLVALFMWARK